MRLFVSTALATVTLFAFAAAASAASFTFENVTGLTGSTPGYANPGDNITAELWLNTGPDAVQAWFLQVNHGGGGTASAAASDPFLFVAGTVATPLGQPVLNSAAGGDATGQFAFTVSPPGSFAPQNVFKYGSISLTAGPSDISLDISEAGGAVGGPGGQNLVAEGLVSFGIIPVPEPSVALLGFAALGTLGLVRSLSGQRSA